MKHRNSLTALASFLGISLAGSWLTAAQVTLFEEGFETDGNGTRYVLEGEGDDGQLAFFARRQLGSTGVEARDGTVGGTWIFGISDLDGMAQDRIANFPHLGSREGQIFINDLDVSGVGNLRFEMAVATGEGTHEADNEMVISVRFDDGDWVDVGGFKSASSNTPPKYFAGPANTVTMADWDGLLTYFLDWGWDIVGNGSSMDVRIFVDSNYYEEDYFLDNLRVIGDDDVALMTVAFEQSDVTEPTEGAVANPLTVTLDAPAPAGGVEINVNATREGANSVNFPDTMMIPEGQTTATFATEVMQDGGFTGTELNDFIFTAPGFNNAMARLTITNSTPEPTKLVVMEIHAATTGSQPSDLKGDANNDGRRGLNDDQFIEIVNFEDYPIDLSGWTLGEEIGDRHLIPEGTILQPRTALVVFGGGQPSGAFGGAIVQTSSSGGNGLGYDHSSGPDFAYIAAPFGVRLEEHEMWQTAIYKAETVKLPTDNPAYDQGASQTRTTETRDAEWEMHPFVDGANYALYSPGTWPDGTTYFETENTVSVALSADTIAEDSTDPIIATVTLAEAAGAGGLEVTIETEGVMNHDDGSFSPDEISLESLNFTIPEGSTEATFEIHANNDGVLDGDRRVDMVLRAGAYVLPASASFTVTDVAAAGDLAGIYISEVMVDVEGAAFDINMDGTVEDRAGDQFVELVNNTGHDVNLSGWTMSWNDGTVFSVPFHVHRFPEGTWIPDGGSIVAIGWIGDDKVEDPSFEGAIVQGALNMDGSRQFVGLNMPIGRDVELSLFNRYGYEVDLVVFEADWGEQNQSVVIDSEGTMALHLDVAANFSSFSPGLDHTTGAAYAGNGKILLPMMFTRTAASTGSGWFWDPTFGWLYTGAPVWDIPWVYSDSLATYWYVLEPSALGGIWLYDYSLSSWCFTTYEIFPWMWVHSSSEWQQRTGA